MGIVDRGGWILVLVAILIPAVFLSACTQTSESSRVTLPGSPGESPSPLARQVTAGPPSTAIPESSTPACQNETCMVREYLDVLYPVQKGDEYPILYDTKEAAWLKDQVPGAELVQAYAKFRMPAVSATFIFFQGRAYAMPGEFNDFIRDAGVQVGSGADALGLADLYVKAWEPWGSYGIAPAIIASGPEDIPQRRYALPPVVAARIHPPAVTVKEEGWDVGLFTWSMVGGTVREWNLTIARNGTILESRNEPLGNLLGDYLAMSW